MRSCLISSSAVLSFLKMVELLFTLDKFVVRNMGNTKNCSMHYKSFLRVLGRRKLVNCNLSVLICEYRSVLLPHIITIDRLKNPSPVTKHCKYTPTHTPAITPAIICRVVLIVVMFSMFDTMMDLAREDTGTTRRFQT